ncbi:MAG: toll/interleukin-1 receptor domain-containing protein [Candidatus Eremiobacteraeota bacterium]|nr:toll/interleukin-1 receptor domain-containing protein [Candidatus Eremiobacteraeota bacterium]
MHAYISKNTYWRTGVVLKKDDNEALVRADIEDKKIFISIRGKDKTRCVFLEIIRSYLEGIHSTISGIEVKGKVPMPDNPDIVVDYEHLLLLEESGEKTYIPEGAIKRYSIKELLDGIESEKEQKPHISRSKIESGDYDVFLCYNYQDKQEVSEIGERLKKRGILPWLGEWELQPGMQFQEVIEKQSKHVKSVVIFVGAGGIGPWQKQEYSALIREMIERQRPVIPVFLHNCPNNVQFPLFLRMFLSVDFRKSETSPFESLVSGITEGREHVE